jgi:hypothetical protein
MKRGLATPYQSTAVIASPAEVTATSLSNAAAAAHSPARGLELQCRGSKVGSHRHPDNVLALVIDGRYRDSNPQSASKV